MTADIFGQFIEAIACFVVGAYFGVKFAFTEIIGACSGKVIRGILQFIYGLSYVVSLGFVIYVIADGDFHYYHFMLQFLGALAFVPLSRKVFRRFKKPIQKIWLRFIGRVDLLAPVKTPTNAEVHASANTNELALSRKTKLHAKRHRVVKKSQFTSNALTNDRGKKERRKHKKTKGN